MRRERDSNLNFNKKQFYRQVVTIALPIAIQELITTSLSLVDNVMVGSLGEAQLAAVGAGIQLFMMHILIVYGFTSGTATFIAQLWGAGDMKRIKQTVGMSIAVCASIGVIFFVIANVLTRPIMSLFSTDEEVIAMGCEYIKVCSPAFICLGISEPLIIALRATQQTKLPLFTSMITFSMNTFLNFVFIFGAFGMPRLETTGAAVGTVVARVVEMVILLIIVFPCKNVVGGKPAEFVGISGDLARRIVKNTVPTTANESLWQLGHSVYLAVVGHISVSAYAAMQAGLTISNILFMFSFSLGSATLIMIGEKLGENEIELAKVYANQLMKTALAVGAICGILLISASGLMVGLFDFSETGAMYCRRILIVIGLFMALDVYNGCVITGVLRSGGDTLYAATGELSCVWLVGVPLAFIGAFWLELPVYLVLLLIKGEEVVKCIVMTVRLFSNKWAKNVIKNIEG